MKRTSSPLIVKVPRAESPASVADDSSPLFSDIENINKLHYEMLENPVRVEPEVAGQPLSPRELDAARRAPVPQTKQETVPKPPATAMPPPPPPDTGTSTGTAQSPAEAEPPSRTPPVPNLSPVSHASPTFDVNKFIVPQDGDSDEEEEEYSDGNSSGSESAWTVPPHLAQSRRKSSFTHSHVPSGYEDSYTRRFNPSDDNLSDNYDDLDSGTETQRYDRYTQQESAEPYRESGARAFNPYAQQDSAEPYRESGARAFNPYAQRRPAQQSPSELDDRRAKAQVMMLKLNDIKARADMKDELAHMPEVDMDTDPKTIETLYYHTIHKLKVRSQAVWYKQVLFAACYVLELVLGYVVGLDMEGFAFQQWKDINKYDDLLIELGAKYMSESATQFPVEMRLVGVLMFNAALYALSRGSGPVKLVGKFLGMFYNPSNGNEPVPAKKAEPAPPRPKSMKPPARVRVGAKQQ